MGLDDIKDFLADAWDSFLEGLIYIFSFEWVSDLGEFFGSMLENISEFSLTGLITGVLTFAVIFLLRKRMLNPFLVHMGPAEAFFWGTLTYVISFVGGYLIGKNLFDN